MNRALIVMFLLQCYLRVGDEIRNSAWLKYGKRFPKIKAAAFKDHKKAKDKSNSNADITKAAMEAFTQSNTNQNTPQA